MLAGDQVIICRVPKDGRYTEIGERKRGDAVSPSLFPEVILAVDEIFG